MILMKFTLMFSSVASHRFFRCSIRQLVTQRLIRLILRLFHDTLFSGFKPSAKGCFPVRVFTRVIAGVNRIVHLSRLEKVKFSH